MRPWSNNQANLKLIALIKNEQKCPKIKSALCPEKQEHVDIIKLTELQQS